MSEWGSRKYKHKADGNEKKTIQDLKLEFNEDFRTLNRTQAEMSIYLKNPVIQLKLKWKLCK